MKRIKTVTGKLLLGRIVFATVVLLCLPAILFSSYAQCTYENSGYVFKHPVFSDVHWRASLDSIGVIIPEEICVKQNLGMAFSDRKDSSLAIILTKGDSLSIVRSYLINVTGICAQPVLQFDIPSPILTQGIDFKESVPIQILRLNSANSDLLKLIICDVNNKILSINIKPSTKSIINIDTIKTQIAQNIQITGVFNAYPNFLQPGVVVTGHSGIIKYIPYVSGAWGTPKEYSIAQTENVTSFGDSLIGTESGKIYKFNGTTFVYVSKPVSKPVRIIKSTSGYSDGNFLYRLSNTWKAFKSSYSGKVMGYNFTSSEKGRTIEYLDTLWNYLTDNIVDSSTSFSVVSPTDVSRALNGPPYIYSGSNQLTVTFQLKDIEGNFTVPQITLVKKNSTVTINQSGQVVLDKRFVNALCQNKVQYFNDSIVTMILNPTSIRLTAVTRTGKFDQICYTCKWLPSEFTNEVPWDLYDGVAVRLGKDSLFIANGHQSTTATLKWSETMISNVKPYVNDNALIVPGIDRIKRIELFDLSGKKILRAEGSSLNNARITIPSVASRLLYVRLLTFDGTAQIHRISLIR